VNALVRSLRETQGIRSFVILIHQGGQQNAPFANGFMDVNRCDNLSGDIALIVQQLDPQVDVVISAHTHQPYVCPNYAGTNILLTSASSFGRLITDIDLRIDHQTKDITRNVAKDADQTALVNKYAALSAPIANRVVGTQSADITRATTPAGESALGDVIADAQLASTSPTDFGGAVVDTTRPASDRVIPGSVAINGVPVDPLGPTAWR
jgi:5'-nucleotidase